MEGLSQAEVEVKWLKTPPHIRYWRQLVLLDAGVTRLEDFQREATAITEAGEPQIADAA